MQTGIIFMKPDVDRSHAVAGSVIDDAIRNKHNVARCIKCHRSPGMILSQPVITN